MIFRPDLVDFQSGQLVEAELQNRIGLSFAEGIAPAGQPGFVSADKGGVVRIAELQSQGYLYLRP